MENILYPKKVLFSEGNVQNADVLIGKGPLQIGLYEDKVVSFTGKTALVLDYGKEIPGKVLVLT